MELNMSSEKKPYFEINEPLTFRCFIQFNEKENEWWFEPMCPTAKHNFRQSDRASIIELVSQRTYDQALADKDKEIEVLSDAAQFALVHWLDKVIKPNDQSEVFTTGRIQLKQALRSVGKIPLEPNVVESLKRVATSISETYDQSLTIRKQAVEIEELRKQRQGLIARLYKTDAWKNLILDASDTEIEAKKAEVK